MPCRNVNNESILFFSILTALLSCTPFEQPCSDGRYCVHHTFLCDYFSDCHDNSDESGCVCNQAEEFNCLSGGCVLKDWVCDGIGDCFDDSDEAGCECDQEGMFSCSSGGCIPNIWFCDGIDDCLDASDESDCSKFPVSDRARELEHNAHICPTKLKRSLCISFYMQTTFLPLKIPGEISRRSIFFNN